jgi:hypothetical protein
VSALLLFNRVKEMLIVGQVRTRENDGMHVRGLCAAGALWLAACGGNDLSQSGAPDQVPTHPHVPPGPVGADAGAPPGPAPSSDGGAAVTDASGSDSSPPGVPAFCSGAGWSDPRQFVLVGSTVDSIVLVRGDGTRKVVAPLGGTLGNVRLVRAGDYFGIEEYTAGPLHVLRLDSAGQVLLDLEIQAQWGSFRMETDGTMVLGAPDGSEVRILPDGSIERHDAPPIQGTPPTPEGYLVLGDADVAGWQIVALPSSVIPLDDAFYEAATATLQRVRYRSDWVPNTPSKGRLVYIGTTSQGVALVDEGVAEARTTPLPGTLKGGQVYGYDDRIVVRQDDVPVAWLDTASRAVTVLDAVMALIDAGATHVGSRVLLLIKDGTPRRLVDTVTLRDFDLTALNFDPAATYAVHDAKDVSVVTADGVPLLWCNPAASDVRVLNSDTLTGGVSPGATSETLYTDAGALVVSEGLPRSWMELATEKVSMLTLAAPAGAMTKTHRVGDRALVTVDGAPSFIVDVGTGAVSNTDAILGPMSYDSVTTAAPWLVAFSGPAPVFRVNTDSGEVKRFAAAAPPLSYGFYDGRFAGNAANYPPIKSSFSGGHLDVPAITGDGNVLSALRDDVVAGAYRLAPVDQAWQAIGQPFHDVVWTAVAERKYTWVVESGHDLSCYCTWPKVSWTSPQPGAAQALTDAVQLIPRGGAPPAIVEGSPTLNFHSSDTCVVVSPDPSTTGAEPFGYDLLLGTKTLLVGMRSMNWIDAQ